MVPKNKIDKVDGEVIQMLVEIIAKFNGMEVWREDDTL
jgi:hypothetical protein